MKVKICWRNVLVWLLIAAFSGCTSMRTVDRTADETAPAVEVGDRVRVVTRDGRELEFTVTRIDGEVLAGNGSRSQARGTGADEFRIPFQDVALVQVESLDGWRTAGLVAGSALLVYTAMFLVAMAIGPALIL
jgi:hypothetical protein